MKERGKKTLLKLVIFFISWVNYFDYQMKLSCNDKGFTSVYLHLQNRLGKLGNVLSTNGFAVTELTIVMPELIPEFFLLLWLECS